jgi:hypothetical protein
MVGQGADFLRLRLDLFREFNLIYTLRSKWEGLAENDEGESRKDKIEFSSTFRLAFNGRLWPRL